MLMRCIPVVLMSGILAAPGWPAATQPQGVPWGDFEPVAKGGRCGVERWAVKTLTDPAASKVSMNPPNSTVEQLAALPVPSGFSANARRLPPEFQTYTVKALLLKVKQEADSDFHLVIAGSSGRTMIAEIPLADCAVGSRVQTQIATVREAFIARFGQPSPSTWQLVNQWVFLTGVLFFDVPHGQTGVAPNAVELHPVLVLQ